MTVCDCVCLSVCVHARGSQCAHPPPVAVCLCVRARTHNFQCVRVRLCARGCVRACASVLPRKLVREREQERERERGRTSRRRTSTARLRHCRIVRCSTCPARSARPAHRHG